MMVSHTGQESGMDQPEHTDVVVLGLGPGGEYVAGTLAEAGLHVTGVESRLVGGECPYYGCVPTKMMIRAANLIAETRRVPGMAGTSAVTPDWSPVARRIREEATDDWNDKVAADRFTGKGGHLVRGRGKITGAGQVAVASPEGTRVYQARTGIVINTGTDPAIPPLEGLADTPYWTNREIVQAERVPESLIVLGGGAIGDVTGKGAFTHMSMYQADIAVRDILGQGGEPADYRAVPRVTFTDPEIGSVGLTEEQARAAGLRVRTGTAQVPYSARGWIHKAGNDGFIKVIEDADRSVLVGASSAGPVGGEVLSALQVAIRADVPVATLRNMPYAYPTFHRAIEDALKDLNRAERLRPS